MTFVRGVMIASFLGLVACKSELPQEVPAETRAGEQKATATAAPVTLKDGDQTTVFKSLFISEDRIAGSTVPQLTFFADEVDCDDRVAGSQARFFAAIATEPGIPPGEYDSPNWGFTGKPGFVPSSENDTDPRASWGKVVITSSDADTVKGHVRYAAKGLSVIGAFTAEKCPPMMGGH